MLTFLKKWRYANATRQSHEGPPIPVGEVTVGWLDAGLKLHLQTGPPAKWFVFGLRSARSGVPSPLSAKHNTGDNISHTHTKKITIIQNYVNKT